MPLEELFRREAVEHRRQRLYGDVVMTVPLTHWAVILVVLVAFLLLVAVLVFGTYARRESVSGWVRPDRGLSQAYTKDGGVVDVLSIAEGQVVRAGQPLLTLRLDPDRSAATGLSARLKHEVEAERQELQLQLDAVRAQFGARETRVLGEMRAVEVELQQYRERLEVHDRRLQLGRKLLEERQLLVRQGFSPPQEAVKQEDAMLALRQGKEELVQELLAKETRHKLLRHELAGLPHERQLATAVLGEKLAALAQRDTQVDRQTRVTLTAPVDGRVASLQVGLGETVRPNSSIVDIVPEGAQLQVELFVPSRASGFVTVGMPVQLRFDAFPYQKFGVRHGRVARISKTTLDARELPPGLSSEEPTYRVIVALDGASNVNRSVQTLQVGMTLKADLLMERRRVVEYVFAPLLGLMERR